jgi:hypothetical protein
VKVILHPEAEEEFLGAQQHYSAASEELGRQFSTFSLRCFGAKQAKRVSRARRSGDRSLGSRRLTLQHESLHFWRPFARLPQIVIRLHAQPELGACPKSGF